MTIIADILLVAGALGASIYCFVLSKRLKQFNDLENGVGGAVAAMALQVDDLKQVISTAVEQANLASNKTMSAAEKAETIRRQLELQIAALHDIPDIGNDAPTNTDHIEGGIEDDEVATDEAHPEDQIDEKQVMFTRRSA